MTSFEGLRKKYNDHFQRCLEEGLFNDQFAWVSDASESDKKSALDQALRDTLLLFLQTNKENMAMLETFVTFCIELCRAEQATTSMPVVLLSDIFDVMTLDRCEKLFAYVEENVTIWKEEMFFASCKNNLLRMCNDLLRRLSRSQQTVFCGRILLFLAKFFPFSERSGLNIVSEFNLENHTEFGSEKTDKILPEPMDEDGKDAEAKLTIDYNLYKKFWALQDFFRNPNQCYHKVHWKIFSGYATDVLSAFASFKLDDQRNCTASTSLDSSDGLHKETHYFAKYLTNQKLLELQLSDSNFRRFILLQFLILFQYLNSTVKFKNESHELKSEQVDWVNTTTEQVFTLLTETPPDGKAFSETVKNILEREKYWNAWKNDGCPAFKKIVSEDNDGDEPPKRKRQRRMIGDIIRDAQSAGKYHMGNPELTKLWNLCPNNLEACKSKDRNFLPSLETYFEEAIMQLDPEAQVEEEYKKVNDGSFGWRALRLLARRSPHFFVHGNNPINKLPEYLELMIKKIAKDRPAQSDPKGDTEETPPSEANDQEDNEDLLKPETEQIEKEKKPRDSIKMPEDKIEKLSEALKGDWKKLATQLGFTPKEISYFGGKSTKYEQCKQMLEVWAGAELDDSLERTLEELQFTDALAILKA